MRLKIAAITVFFLFMLLCFSPAGEYNHPMSGKVSSPALSGPSLLNYTASPINVSVGSLPFFMAVDPENGEVYVLNTNSSNVSVIAVNKTVVDTIPVPKYPNEIIYDPYNHCMYITNGSPLLTVINTTTQSVSYIRTGLVGTENMVYDSRNNDIYAFNPSRGISVISPSGLVIKNLTYYTSFYIDSPTVYDPYDNSVYFLGDSEYSTGVASLNLSSMNTSYVNISPNMHGNSYGIVFDPSNGCVYVITLAHNLGNTMFNLTVIDPSTNAVTQYYIPGLLPYSIAYDSRNQDIVVDASPYSYSGLLFYFLNAKNNLSFTVHAPLVNFVGPFVYNPLDNSLYASGTYNNQVTVFPLSPPGAGSNEGMFLVYGVISVAVGTASILTWAWIRMKRKGGKLQ
ncbi:MAG: hypothetical protein ACYDAZ_08590 [Thermoplasmataceae archaeon]